MEGVDGSIVQVATSRPEAKTVGSPIPALRKEFAEMGYPNEALTLNGQEVGLVFVGRKKIPNTVRVYRGVTEASAANIFGQTAYLTRDVNYQTGEVRVRDDLMPLVQELADEPSLANLRKAAAFALQGAAPSTQLAIVEGMGQVEEDVLQGLSVRRSLLHIQVERNGGYTDTSIAPYVAAGHDPSETFGYASASGVNLVLNVPVARIQNFGGKIESETTIKTQIAPQDVVAVLDVSLHNSPKELQQVLAQVNTKVGWTAEDVSQASQLQAEVYAKEQEWDQRQLLIDQKILRSERAAELAKKYPDLKISEQELESEAQESGKDVYTLAKEKVFDHLAERLEIMGVSVDQRGLDYKPRVGSRQPFSRDIADDEMLFELDRYVNRMEEHHLPDLAPAVGLSEDAEISTIRNALAQLLTQGKQQRLVTDTFYPNKFTLGRLHQQIVAASA